MDEIGDIPNSVQTNLLRVLQEREIIRIGEHRPRKVNVPVLAATNRNLANEVAEGRFREDLFYRIRVGRIHLPALRDRREDIPLLVAEFLRLAAGVTGKKVKEVSQEAMQQLLAQDWPGNVRELKSAIDVAVLKCKGSVITPADLPEEDRLASRAQTAARNPAATRQAVLDAIERASGNRGEAARPTSALDPALIGEVLNLVRELAAGGMTMVIATHEMAFAREIANRVCFLDQGRILEQGTPEQIFSAPQEQRTQEFLRRIIEAGRL